LDKVKISGKSAVKIFSVFQIRKMTEKLTALL